MSFLKLRKLVPICLVVVLSFLLVMPHTFAAPKAQTDYPLISKANPSSYYDVIVVGTDPEGVVAAISAARNKLKVLLIDGGNRKVLGGLMTLGWLNSLDLNKSPNISKKFPSPFLNQGIFLEWYKEINSTSFDVKRATQAFHKMVLSEPNIDVMMNLKQIDPVMQENKIIGISLVTDTGKPLTIRAGAVIDATQNADIAAAAGVPYTVNWEDIGEPDVRVAVTLVFKLSGVTDAVWKELQKNGVGFDKQSIWGYSDAREYKSSNPTRVKMRGLNIGRQNDNTLLINSMQIYDIDPLDPKSIKEGLELGKKEAPLIVNYLKKKYKVFSKLTYAGTAPELYVRESRHIQGEYRLTIADLMNNRDHWDAIAYGAYEADIQTINHTSSGSIIMNPKQYGVPFRSLVPKEIDGLLVVGRSASFDTLAHGSARVIPLGMATGEAAGAAVKLAKERNLSFRQLSKSWNDIVELRKRLTKQGMNLKMVDFAKPSYTKHKYYNGLLTAVSLFITSGGYLNEGWKLDEPAKEKILLATAQRLHKMYPEQFANMDYGWDKDLAVSSTVSLDRAAYFFALITSLDTTEDEALNELVERGWIGKSIVNGIKNNKALTNGELFMILRDVLDYYLGVTFK
ncbi:FAD-dependent oxidoreductase [Cohnella abietis]|uniref:FAD-dependent oxidoreductase n=1 Tax=Cohnella abietis TaxID=2507935 RepID=A0A3T1DAN0_9BACL|nr:FAD-dependent oxidoreductase [Cohnella abietis]BBI35084.1 hypothetical protein KCTCHS21_44830 [Cohnella abietis]